MRDRLLRAALATVRVVLVLVAFALAVGSIAVSTVRGFCPEGEADAALAMAGDSLATIVEQTEAPLDAPADPSPTEAPADGTGTESDGEVGGACPDGRPRCLPPLVSSILVLGDTTCNDEAGARLRSTLVPAFVGSTVLLAIAWWLRPSRLPWFEDEPVYR